MSSPVAGSRSRPLSPVNRILAIRFARLGDVALMLPALERLRAMYPDAHLTFMTGSPYAPLVRMCPLVDAVVGVDRHAMRDGGRFRAAGAILRLVGSTRRDRYDLALDFHSFRETNLLCRLSGARYRLGLRRADRAYLPFCFNLPPVVEDKSLHMGEIFGSVVGGLPGSGAWSLGVGAPLIVVPGAVTGRVRERWVPHAGGPLVAVYVGASVESRRWPADRFAAIVGHAVSQWGASVLLLTGVSPSEQAMGREIAAAVDAPDRVGLLPGLEIPDLAAAIGMSRLLVSSDTGPMHFGPLLRVPTLGIFSQSLPGHYRPIGEGDRYVHRETVSAIAASEVVGVMDEMWSAGSGVSPDRRS